MCCVNALHHFGEPGTVIGEVARVLRESGIFAVVGMDPQVGSDQWYLYDYFPGTLERDQERYPPTQHVERWMACAGLQHTRVRSAARIRHSLQGERIFDDPVLQKNGTSQLALLTDEAFRAGMRRIRSAIVDNPKVVFSIDVTLYLTLGTRDGRAMETTA